jgi:hypothetical protein
MLCFGLMLHAIGNHLIDQDLRFINGIMSVKLKWKETLGKTGLASEKLIASAYVLKAEYMNVQRKF